MDMYQHSKAIFAQLGAEADTQAVKTLIENHDAWNHADAVETCAAFASMAVQAPDGAAGTRVAQQRRRLGALVTRVPVRYATAG